MTVRPAGFPEVFPTAASPSDQRDPAVRQVEEIHLEDFGSAPPLWESRRAIPDRKEWNGLGQGG